MSSELINQFNRVLSCLYDGEKYTVRDNGAVMRHVRDGMRKRPLDNKWTFGRETQNGYLIIAKHRIHRIVCTAFQGGAPSDDHIVDHIDNNRKNNRPDNLIWRTRAENILLNPYSRKRVEYITGVTAEEFLKNPNKYKDKFDNTNYSFMQTVTNEQAQEILEKQEYLLKLPDSERALLVDKHIKKGVSNDADKSHNKKKEKEKEKEKHSDLEREKRALEYFKESCIYRGFTENEEINPSPLILDKLYNSRTEGVMQIGFRCLEKFPLCVNIEKNNPLDYYFKKLKEKKLAISLASNPFSDTELDNSSGGDVNYKNDVITILAAHSRNQFYKRKLYRKNWLGLNDIYFHPFSVILITYNRGNFIHRYVQGFDNLESAKRYIKSSD